LKVTKSREAKEMSKELNEHYEKLASAEQGDTVAWRYLVPEVGGVCVARCAFTDTWERAEVVELLPPDQIRVSFVDSGRV
jgi:hypothetical protein